jgi:cardiolipin synthase
VSDSSDQSDAGPFTIPNLITLIRLLCIPLFLVLLFGYEDRVAAAILLAILGVTDWVDGYLARRLGQVSEVGKVLDPTADRILFLVAVFAMIIDGSVPMGFAIAVLAREIVVSVTVLILAAFGARRIDVTWWGKTGTFGLMVAFPLFLLAAGGTALSGLWETVAWIIGVPSLAISYYAAFTYIPLARRALADGRRARHVNSDAPLEVESEVGAEQSETPPASMG